MVDGKDNINIWITWTIILSANIQNSFLRKDKNDDEKLKKIITLRTQDVFTKFADSFALRRRIWWCHKWRNPKNETVWYSGCDCVFNDHDSTSRSFRITWAGLCSPLIPLFLRIVKRIEAVAIHVRENHQLNQSSTMSASYQKKLFKRIYFNQNLVCFLISFK